VNRLCFEVSFQCCWKEGLSEINTLSECHKSFLHKQTLYDTREYPAEFWLPTSEAAHLSANNTVRGASVVQHHFTELS